MGRRRLQLELRCLLKDPLDGVKFDTNEIEQNLYTWQVQITGPPGTLYEGEHFNLQFKFSPKYPFESPEVTFTGENIPVHRQVYSNGHICHYMLTEGWSPAKTVQWICLSMIAMLSTVEKKRPPPDNDDYVNSRVPGSSPKILEFDVCTSATCPCNQ